MDMEGTWAKKVWPGPQNVIKESTANYEDRESDSNQVNSFGQLFEHFTSETTLHGIKYTTKTKFNLFRRVLWGLLVFAMLAVFTYEFVKSSIKYLEYDVSTVINVNYVQQLDFPAVTICNYNQWRASASGEDGVFLNRLLYPISEEFRLSDKEIENLLSGWNVTGFNMLDYARYAAHQKETMVVLCKWQSGSICSHEDFEQVITEFGVCYTFHRGSDEAMTVQLTGSDNGLYLRLGVEQEEYTSNLNTGAGFKVYLHPPSEIPLPKSLGFAISPGFEYLVGVKYKKIKKLPSPYPSKCQTKSLKYVGTYTKGACDLECKSDYIMEQCGCQHYLLPGYKDASGCVGAIHFTCADKVLENFTKAYNDFCDCPEPCTSTTYESKVSSAYWPSEYVSKIAIEYSNLTEDDKEIFRIGYLDMRIYFEELSYEEIVQVPAYTSSDYQSTIGGFLGLYLGASLITVAEFLDFMIDYISKKIDGKYLMKGANIKST